MTVRNTPLTDVGLPTEGLSKTRCSVNTSGVENQGGRDRLLVRGQGEDQESRHGRRIGHMGAGSGRRIQGRGRRHKSKGRNRVVIQKQEIYDEGQARQGSP
ncbi:hypothetical protein CHARACLAT_027765 [Characodon lateralis]|uniref:Uncharacterized protein n=1 Tax=Characodon lateralis TaxID=208331 RepID=A0ABU7CRS5_9TELE|nr:hypothetical protein [Characodon lateralis]